MWGLAWGVGSVLDIDGRELGEYGRARLVRPSGWVELMTTSMLRTGHCLPRSTLLLLAIDTG